MCTIRRLIQVLQDTIDNFNNERKVVDSNQRTRPYFYDIMGNERSVVFRIAHELANKIENNKEFQDIYVDVEPRKYNRYSKLNPKTDRAMTPDIIIHKRKGKGYIVVEVKCEDRPTITDCMKLSVMTMSEEKRAFYDFILHYPAYEVGIMIRLRNASRTRPLVEYNYFYDGNEIEQDRLWEKIR